MLKDPAFFLGMTTSGNLGKTQATGTGGTQFSKLSFLAHALFVFVVAVSSHLAEGTTVQMSLTNVTSIILGTGSVMCVIATITL